MQLIVEKTLELSGTVIAPSSKSHSIRAIFLALLANGESTLNNALDSEDVRDAVNVAKQIGAHIECSGDELIIRSNGFPFKPKVNILNSGNSGITTHFLLPILGLRQNVDEPIRVDCGEQMRARPIQAFIKALESLGFTIECLEKPGFFPLQISGRLQGGNIEIDGLNSQPLSALLIALPCAKTNSKVFVRNLHEVPYVEMTLEWLNKRNMVIDRHVQEDSLQSYNILGNQIYTAFDIKIPNDFSSAANIIAAAVLTQSDVNIEGLNLEDSQGDKQLIPILQAMGAEFRIKQNQITIKGGKKLKGISINAKDFPDLLPILGVIATQAKGVTEINHVGQARIKETDRIKSITEGLRRLGATVEENKDGIKVSESKLQGAHLQGYGDHRTVMALSIAGMLSEQKTSIEDGETVNKTFPDFVKVMKSLGARMEVENETSR